MWLHDVNSIIDYQLLKKLEKHFLLETSKTFQLTHSQFEHICAQPNLHYHKNVPFIFMFQESTRNAYALAAICPVIFILVPFFQYWLFHLYHKYGHPWSQIIYPDQDLCTRNFKRKDQLEKPDANLKYFFQFWKHVENESEAKGMANPAVVDSAQSSILTLDSV